MIFCNGKNRINNNGKNNPISGFLENVVLNDVNNPASPFLLGRCLWIGSKFPAQISAPAMTRFMEATVSGLAADKPAIVRISAVRAIWGFSQHLRASKNRALMTPFLPAVTDALINMCAAFNSSSEVLGLIMENMSLVLAVCIFPPFFIKSTSVQKTSFKK